MMEQKTLEKEFSSGPSGIPVPLPILKVRIEAIMILLTNTFLYTFSMKV